MTTGNIDMLALAQLNDDLQKFRDEGLDATLVSITDPARMTRFLEKLDEPGLQERIRGEEPIGNMVFGRLLPPGASLGGPTEDLLPMSERGEHPAKVITKKTVKAKTVEAKPASASDNLRALVEQMIQSILSGGKSSPIMTKTSAPIDINKPEGAQQMVSLPPAKWVVRDANTAEAFLTSLDVIPMPVVLMQDDKGNQKYVIPGEQVLLVDAGRTADEVDSATGKIIRKGRETAAVYGPRPATSDEIRAWQNYETAQGFAAKGGQGDKLNQADLLGLYSTMLQLDSNERRDLAQIGSAENLLDMQQRFQDAWQSASNRMEGLRITIDRNDQSIRAEIARGNLQLANTAQEQKNNAEIASQKLQQQQLMLGLFGIMASNPASVYMLKKSGMLNWLAEGANIDIAGLNMGTMPSVQEYQAMGPQEKAQLLSMLAAQTGKTPEEIEAEIMRGAPAAANAPIRR